MCVRRRWDGGLVTGNAEIVFCRTISFILFFTGVVKIYSGMGSADILQLDNPLIPISNKDVLLFSGFIELVASGFVGFSRSVIVRLSITLWLGCTFLFYHIALHFSGEEDYCSCLGTLTDQLPGTPNFWAQVALGISILMVMGSTMFWFSLTRRIKCRTTG